MEFKMKRVLILVTAVLIGAAVVNGQKLKAEEIVEKHLASMAAPEKRASIQSMIASGEVRVEFITQKTQPAVGRIVFASEGSKRFFGMQLNSADYPQEKFVFDGSKTDVALIRAGNRSILGNFVQSNSSLVSQGFMTGTLMTGWVMSNAVERGAKLSASGTKKIDGKEAYVLSITPKGGSDLDITMYFDQATFRHLRTEYKRTASAAMGATIDQSARNIETRIKLTEDFSDHQEFEGVMLPRKYRLHYSISGQNGTTEISWESVFTEFAFNQKLDPSSFATGK
jgi:outer membrane lipoprotein-sorting protein